MVHFEQSVVIERSPEKVFAFLANPQNDPQWSSASHEMHKTSEGPIDVGTTFEQVGRFLGRPLRFSLEVTAYEPNRRFGMKVTSGPIKFAGMRVLKTDPAGTLVSFPHRRRPAAGIHLPEAILATWVGADRVVSLASQSHFWHERPSGS